MADLIAFDLDGVLYNWHELVHDYAVLNNLVDSSVDYYTMWSDVGKYLSQNVQKNIVLDLSLYDKYIISPKLLEFMNNIHVDYDIIYVTSRPIEAQHVTYNWLKKNKFPCAEFVYFTEDKSRVCRTQKCKYFIEDQPKHAVKLKDITNLYMVEQPWNVHCRSEYAFIRNVYELENILWRDYDEI